MQESALKRMDTKKQDIVEITTKDAVYKGKVMPSPVKDTIVLKLDSGYNIGIPKKTIKKSVILKKQKPIRKVMYKQKKQQKNTKTITVIHTGGTISSVVDYETGGVVSRYTPEDLLSMFPELRGIANIKTVFLRNMWSQDMRFSHYNLILKEVEKQLKSGVDGIIITHGTDTLGYTAAALSFAIEGLNNPVLLVAAQRSSDRGSSDAAANLISAANFITKADFAGVAICMHEETSDKTCVILPATKTRKFHSSRRDAFKPVNTSPIARVYYKSGTVEFLTGHYLKKDQKRKLQIKSFKENLKIGLFRFHPNMFAEQLLFYKNYHGLVIEASGLGHLSTTKIDEKTAENQKIFNALTLLVKKGVFVVLAPQTIFGRLNLNVYENQRKLKEIGVLGDGSDMLSETTFIKLAWLLSNYKKEEISTLLMTNLRGELNERLQEEMFL